MRKLSAVFFLKFFDMRQIYAKPVVTRLKSRFMFAVSPFLTQRPIRRKHLQCGRFHMILALKVVSRP